MSRRSRSRTDFIAVAPTRRRASATAAERSTPFPTRVFTRIGPDSISCLSREESTRAGRANPKLRPCPRPQAPRYLEASRSTPDEAARKEDAVWDAHAAEDASKLSGSSTTSNRSTAESRAFVASAPTATRWSPMSVTPPPGLQPCRGCRRRREPACTR